MKYSKNVKIFAFSSVLLALSIILSYVENLIPFNAMGVGVRIGLSNICVVIGIESIGKVRTFVITMLRILILSLLFGSIVKFYISLSGFVFSFIFMCLYSIAKNYDIIILSIIGGAFHIIGQFIALVVLFSNMNILYLLPPYTLIGIITGAIVGLISKLILNKIKVYL